MIFSDPPHLIFHFIVTILSDMTTTSNKALLLCPYLTNVAQNYSHSYTNNHNRASVYSYVRTLHKTV